MFVCNWCTLFDVVFGAVVAFQNTWTSLQVCNFIIHAFFVTNWTKNS